MVTIGPTGFMTETFSSGGTPSVMINSLIETRLFQVNNFVKFSDPSNVSIFKWARIVDVENNGELTSGLVTDHGPWTLSVGVPAHWRALEVIVSMRRTLTASEQVSIQDQIISKKTFGVGYDVTGDDWYIIELKDLDTTAPFGVVNAKNTTGLGRDSSWIVLMEVNNITSASYRYNATTRGEIYVVQSRSQMKFYNIKNVKVTDSNNRTTQDTITFTALNPKPGINERLVWADSDYDGIADSWFNTVTGTYHRPIDYATNIPLRTRGTNWHDVKIDWKSNFGLLQGNSMPIAEVLAGDRFVSEAVVRLNAWFDDGSAASLTNNVTIANNSGQVTRIPSSIEIPFNNVTFGANLFDSTGNITYKQQVNGVVQVFTGNATILSNTAVSGTILLEDANASAQTGKLVYTNLENNIYHHSSDKLGLSADSIVVTYVTDREKLDEPIVWAVDGNFKYEDGYTDNYRLIVSPVDSDGDLVPDRPLQFTEYVDSDDLVLYEYFNDFDGYSYERPILAAILDYRGETGIDRNFTESRISPLSHTATTDLTVVDWIIVDNLDVVASLENDLGKASGIKVHDVTANKTYLLTPASTNLNQVRFYETNDYFVRKGRGATQNSLALIQDAAIIRWQHVAPNDVRINPSISNVIEMIVLTASYHTQVMRYMNVPAQMFPLAPTGPELEVEFAGLLNYKAASDSIVFRSGKFKILFGADADPMLQAKFRVVKLTEQLSDNEIRSRVVEAINKYFEIDHWAFGETFYFTELSSYIHQQLGSSIGSIVIIPKNNQGKFGDLFQVRADPDELFLSTAKPTDIELIDKISTQTLRVDR